ncbi:MAG: MFS transporter [bacterium]|nr:MFS transporter [bacterium]
MPPDRGGGFPALRHRIFRRYVLGQGVSLIGFWMQSVAQAWLVYRLSGSTVALGVVSACAFAPIALLAPVAGVIADRVSKRNLIVLTQTAAMLLAFTLGTLVAFDLATVPLVAVMAAGLGVIGAFDLPTRQAFLVEMVGPQDLASAIALNASIFNTARVVGPAIAGSLVGTIGEAPCFFLNGISYLGVLWALAGIPARAPGAGAASDRGDLFSGLRYVRRHRALGALLIALGVVSALALQANVLMPAFAERTFAGGPTAYGLLLTAFGTGAVLSALRLAWRRWTRSQHRANLLLGLGVFALGLLGVAASPRLEVALACQLLAGLGMIRFTATTNTLIQLLVDDRYRGRVMGLHTVMFMGTAPIGSLVLGVTADALGLRAALGVAGAAPLVALAFLFAALPPERAHTHGA